MNPGSPCLEPRCLDVHQDLKSPCLERAGTRHLNSAVQVGPVLPGFPVRFSLSGFTLAWTQCRQGFIKLDILCAAMCGVLSVDLLNCVTHNNSELPQMVK